MQILNLFKSFDIFGQRVEFNIKNQKQFKTSSGGFLTFCLCAILFTILYKKLIEYLNKSSEEINQTIEFQNNPKFISLQQDNFMFAVTIEQNSNVYTKQPYYLIEVEQRNYERDEEGNLIKNKIPYVLEPCTTEHWENIYSTETNDKLFGLEIESFLCPPLDFKPLSLQGVYQSDFFDFIKFNIVDCEEPEQKTEYFQNWDYTCLSDTEIAEYIEKDGDLRFQIIVSNNLINPQSDDIITQFISNEFYYTFKPGEIFVSADIFVQDLQMHVFNNIFPYQNQDIQYLNYTYMSSNEVKESYSMTKYEGEYSSIYLRKSRFQTTYEKRFMQLEDLISYIGGFSNILFLFFGAIAYQLNYQQQLVQVANSIYYFKRRQEYKNEQIQKEKDNQKILEKPVALSFKNDNLQNALSLKLNNQENEKKGRNSIQIKQIIKNRTLQLITQYGYKTRFEYLTAQLQQKIMKNSNVVIQFRYYIYMLSCKKLFNNEENQLIEKAKVLAESQLDVIQIIDRIQEIDRLKNVIFTKEQLTLFNYFPKKEICISEEQNQNINKNKNFIFSKQLQHKNQNLDKVQSRMSFFTQMKNKELDNYSQQFEDLNRAQLEKLESQQNSRKQLRQKTMSYSKRTKFFKSQNISLKTAIQVYIAKSKFLSLIQKTSTYNQTASLNQYKKLYQAFDKIIENRHPAIYFQSMKQSDSVKNNLDPLQQKKYSELQSGNDIQQRINLQLIKYIGKELEDIFTTSKLLQFPKDKFDKQRRKQVLINLRIKNLKEKVIQQKEKEETTVVTQASAKFINIQESPIKKKYPKIPLMTYNHLNDIKKHYNTQRSSEINNNRRNQTQKLTFISDQQKRNQIFNPFQKQKVKSENFKDIKQELQKNDDISNKSSLYQNIPVSQFSQQINSHIKEQGQFIDYQSQQKENEESLLRLSSQNNLNIGQKNNNENQINKNLKINIQRQNSKRSQISSNLYDLEPSTNRKLISNYKQELQDKNNQQSMQFKDYIENKNSSGLEVSNQNNDKSNFEISNIHFLPSYSKQLQQEIQYIENKSKLNKSQSPQNSEENDNNNNDKKNDRVININQNLQKSDDNISQNQECTSKSGNQKEENFKNNLVDEDKNINFNQTQTYINSFFQFMDSKNTFN